MTITVLPVGAQTLYRMAGGNVYSVTDEHAWTVFKDRKKIIGFTDDGVICQCYTTETYEAGGQMVQYANPRYFPNYVTRTNFGQKLILKNHPNQTSLVFGSDITPSLSDLSPTIMAIRVGVALITYERARWIQLSSRTVYQSTSGSNSATTDSASGETVGVYDMGVPWNPPPHIVTPEEIKIKAKKNAETEKNVVKWLFTEATNGSASAQFSLGLRYLKGKGVETNEALGHMWLEKAAAQGDTEASDKLAKLDAARINSKASAISATNSESQSPQSP